MILILLTDDPELVHISTPRAVRLAATDRDLLFLLADRRVHTHADLYRFLFDERLIEPAAVYSRTSKLQRQLGHRILRTVPRKGVLLRDDALLAVPLLLSARRVAYMPPYAFDEPPDDSPHRPII